MIGTRIRGIHHLIKEVEKQGLSHVILWGGRMFFQGMMYCPPTSYGTRQLIFANNATGSRDLDLDIYDSTVRNDIRKLMEEYRGLYIISDKRSLHQFGHEIILLPNTFKQDYYKFCDQNKKIVNSFFGSCCTKDDAIPMWLFAMCGDKPNLWSWAMKSYFKRNATMHQIMHIISWQDNYPQLTGKLSKGTITAYNNADNVMKLFDEIVNLRQGKRANDAINTFNTTQKKLLKSNDITLNRQKMLSRFRTLSSAKQSNFVRKMSTVEDVDEIFRQLSHLVNAHFEWSRDSVVDFINNAENIKCNIVIDENNILLVSVDTYDTIKYLAKSTNWCISKNKSYWNNYMSSNHEATQYVLFDFNRPEDDEYSIVGFTTDRNGLIRHAHSFTNNNMMFGENNNMRRLTTFISDTSSIFTLLNKLGISLKTLMKVPTLKYDWNKESCISFLDYSLGSTNYLILHESEDRLVIESNHPNLKYVIGSSAAQAIGIDGLSDCGGKLLVFFDFLSDDENDKMYIASIFSRNHLEEYCNSVVNIFGTDSSQSFDDLLEDFGLPYDIICRSINPTEQFINDFVNYHSERVDKWLKDKNIIKNVKKNKNYIHNIFTHTLRSIIHGKSMDYLKILYSNDICLSELDEREFRQMITSLIFETGNMLERAQRRYMPNEDEQPQDARNYHEGVALGFIKCINYIFENETNINGFSQISHEIFDLRPQYFSDFICEKLVNLNNVETNDEVIYNIISLACRTNNTNVLEKLTSMDLTQQSLECAMSLLSTSNRFYGIFDEKYKTLKSTSQMSFSHS